MKPKKLIIEGVNSFTDSQELDFETVGRSNLFCICGKTGAGKTTVFDSIMLALYGRSGKGNLADVVNLSRSSAKVIFEFYSDGETYSVERVIKCRAEKDDDGTETGHRTATSECVLYKNGEPIAKGEQATETLTRLIGLGESEFKNVYLLEQGEYAEFLKKTPAKQTEAVGKIFSLMRFGDVNKRAGEKQREAEAEVQSADRRIADLGEDVSVDALNAAKTELSKLRAKNTTLAKEIENKKTELDLAERARDEYISAAEKAKNAKELGIKLSEAKSRLESAEIERDDFIRAEDGKDGERLDALLTRLNELSAQNALDRQYSACVADYREKRTALENKAAADTAASERLQTALDTREKDSSAFDRALAEFKNAVAALAIRSDCVTAALAVFERDERDMRMAAVPEQLYALKDEKSKYDALVAEREKNALRIADASRLCDELISKIEKYNVGLEQTLVAKRSADERVLKAQEELSAAQMRSHAAAVRAELKTGDVCPVCGGVYGGCSDESCGDVSECKAECDAAKAELRSVTDRESELVKFTDKAKSELDHWRAELENHNKTTAELDEKIRKTCVDPETYESMFDALKKAKQFADGYNSSNAEYLNCLAAATESKAVADAASSALKDAEAKARALKEQLGENCGKTDIMIAQLNSDIAELKSKISRSQEIKSRLVGAADSAKAAVETLENALSAASRECPVDMPQFDEDGYREKRAMFDEAVRLHAEHEKDIALKEAQAEQLAQKCDKLKSLTAERAIYVKRADCYKRIVDMTKAKAMLNYVAAEFIEEFTAIASGILSELSGGKYNMDYDRDNGFVVTDFLNDGKARKTDTLSGGELFLASLSVAIAIARAQGKGNNAFFFLDEGFGTLDDDLIDTVYSALESLSKDCLVGVISHAGALIERMPSCVEVLEATDTMGSRIRA